MEDKLLDVIDEKKERREFWIKCIYTYVIMFIFGISLNVKTVVFPLVKKYYNFSDTLQGLLVSISGYGYCINCLLGAFFIKYFGIYNAVNIGSVCLFAGALLTTFSVNAGMVFATLLILYFSFGLFEVTTNCISNSIFLKNTVIYFTTSQFFYGLGSICGPYLAKLMIELVDSDFKSCYYFITALGIVIFVYTLVLQYCRYTIINKDQFADIRYAFKSKLVWLFGIIIGFLVLAEQGITDWATIYLVDVYGYDAKKELVVFATVFFALFTASRLLSGFAIERVGYFKSIIIIVVSEFVVIVVGIISGKYGLYVLPISGIFLSLNWPVMFSIGVKVFKKDSPKYAAIIIFISSLLNNFLQLLVGVINDNMGSAWGIRFIATGPVFAFALLILLFRITKEEMKEIDIEKPLIESIEA